jgi:hypothetical protein
VHEKIGPANVKLMVLPFRIPLIFGLALGWALHAERIVLLPVADTTLSEAAPDYNFGAVTNLTSGTTSAGHRNRALVKFDIAGHIPWNAVVQSVELSVSVVSPASSQTVYNLHRVVRDWREGTGEGSGAGEPAKNGEATWEARLFPDELWTSPGGRPGSDFVEVPTATVAIQTGTRYLQSSTYPALVDDLQKWLTDPATNFGWVFLVEDETVADTIRKFGARETPDSAFALVVDYGPPQLPRLSVPASADTSLFEYTPDNNLGAADLAAGTIAQAILKRSRALLRFPVENIPTNIVWKSASLNLRVSRMSSSAQSGNFVLRRMLQSWEEGNKTGSRGSPATAGESTWNARLFPAIHWSSPGAAAPDDFSTNISSTSFIEGLGSYTFTNLLADIEFWRAHPDQNFGWILISQDEGTRATARRFLSREYGLPGGPELILEYVPQPVIERSESSSNEFRLYFQAHPGQSYFVQASESLAMAEWFTLTNIPPFSAVRTIVIAAPVDGRQRFYRIGF